MIRKLAALALFFPALGLSQIYTVGTGGVTASSIVQLNSSSNAVAMTSGGTYLGIAQTTAIAGSTVNVQSSGVILCRFENATTPNDLVVLGVSTYQYCSDSGQTAPSGISAGTRILGYVTQAVSSGQTATVVLGRFDAYGTGSTSGAAVTISKLTLSSDDTTIVAQWYTNAPSDSHLSCGSKIAADDGVQTQVTFHQAVVTGLTPATPYACSVKSGLTTSSGNSTTAAAPTRTAITSVTVGSATQANTSNHGDTIYNCKSNDGSVYNTMDDGFGWPGGSGAGANMQIDKITNLSTFAGVTVNAMGNYGSNGTSNGTAGPGGRIPLGASMSNKLSGLFCMAGKLFSYQSRIYNTTSSPYPTYLNQPEAFGNLIESNDHGVTWNSWQDPTAFNLLGNPPNPLGSYMYASDSYAWGVPVRYAADDGTLGYLTAGNRQDGGNAFVYSVWTDGWWNNGSNLYLTRVPRAVYANLNPGDTQYWVGPASPASADFVNDANWSYSSASATAIYSAAYQVSAPDEVFVPALNSYLLLTWYNPGGATAPMANSSNSVWTIASGPTPAGPWTVVSSPTYPTTGYYNPVVLHSSLVAIPPTGSTQGLNLTVLFDGDYLALASTLYFPTTAVLTLNPLGKLIDATTTAVFAGSPSHQLKSGYAGALINVERLSDSTTSDIGQNADGTLNQTTLGTFCSGTTCRVMTLYDQSGGGHNATAPAYANAPIIYTGGAVEAINGVPAMWCDGTVAEYLVASQTYSGTLWEGISVMTLANVSTYRAGLGLTDGTHSTGGSANNFAFLYSGNSGPQMGVDYNNTERYIGVTLTAGFYLDSYINTAVSPSMAINVNGVTNTSSNPTGTVASTALYVGNDLPSFNQWWAGKIGDVAIYNANLTTTMRQNAHSIEQSFYGIP